MITSDIFKISVLCFYGYFSQCSDLNYTVINFYGVLSWSYMLYLSWVFISCNYGDYWWSFQYDGSIVLFDVSKRKMRLLKEIHYKYFFSLQIFHLTVSVISKDKQEWSFESFENHKRYYKKLDHFSVNELELH